MLTATIDRIGNELFIKYSTPLTNEPTLHTMWWKIMHVERRSMSIGAYPEVGHTINSSNNGRWVGSGYNIYADGSKPAEKVEFTPIPAPKTKKQTRWSENGYWEKLMARGWVRA